MCSAWTWPECTVAGMWKGCDSPALFFLTIFKPIFALNGSSILGKVAFIKRFPENHSSLPVSAQVYQVCRLAAVM